MNWKRTIFSGFTFLLFVMLYFLDRTLGEKAIFQQVNESSLAPGMNYSQITGVELQTKEGKIVLQKGNEGWMLQEPEVAPADPETIETLLINVTAAKKTNEITPKNLAEYGLVQPDVRVTLVQADKKFELLIGNESTYTGMAYAKYPTDPRVFTVGVQVKNTLQRQARDFRRSRLFDIDVPGIESYQAIEIVGADKTVNLARDGSEWKLSSPFQGPAEKDAVKDYLEKAGLLRATGFVTEKGDQVTSLAAALQALTSPTLTVTIQRGDKAQKLVVAPVGDETKPVYVAQRQGDREVLIIRADTVDGLAANENDFRSRVLFTVKPSEVHSLVVEIGRAKTEIQRGKDGQWVFVEDPGKSIDQKQFDARLDALLRLRIREYVDVAPKDMTMYGLLPPRFKFTVSNADQTKVESLQTGSATGQGQTVFAQHRGDQSVFTIDMSSDLIILPDNIAEKSFMRVPADRIAHVVMSVKGSKYELKRELGEWKLLRPNQTAFATTEAPRVEKLLLFLNNVEYTKDYEGDRLIMPNNETTLSLQFFDEKEQELLNVNLGKRMQAGTIITTGKGRTYEIRNNDADRLAALVQTVAQ